MHAYLEVARALMIRLRPVLGVVAKELNEEEADADVDIEELVSPTPGQKEVSATSIGFCCRPPRMVAVLYPNVVP
jgi:hypothetical protein